MLQIHEKAVHYEIWLQHRTIFIFDARSADDRASLTDYNKAGNVLMCSQVRPYIFLNFSCLTRKATPECPKPLFNENPNCTANKLNWMVWQIPLNGAYWWNVDWLVSNCHAGEGRMVLWFDWSRGFEVIQWRNVPKPSVRGKYLFILVWNTYQTWLTPHNVENTTYLDSLRTKTTIL